MDTPKKKRKTMPVTRAIVKNLPVGDLTVVNDLVIGRYKQIIDVMARDNLSVAQASAALATTIPPAWVYDSANFRRAVEAERDRWQQAYDITRRDIVTGLTDAINMAMATQDAGSAVRGWAEIAKLTGLYAPQRVSVSSNNTHDITVRNMEHMTDAELLRLIRDQATKIATAIPAAPAMQAAPAKVINGSVVSSAAAPTP